MLAQSMLNPIFVVVGADPLWWNVAGKPDPVLGAVELVPAVVHRGGIDHQDERAPAAGAYRGSGGGGWRQGGFGGLARVWVLRDCAGAGTARGALGERGGGAKETPV